MSRANRKRAVTIGVLALLLVALVLFWALVYTPWAEKRKYPLRYEEEIAQAAQEFGIDPYLMTALVHRESSFRAEVVSAAQAVGLAQVTPETGSWIAEKLEIAGYEEAMLRDPLTNLRMGCWYLDWLTQRYGGQVVEALTAYNQGQGMVDAWLEDPAISPDGLSLNKEEDGRTLKGLPPNIVDGKVYAALILAARDHYEELYPNAFAQGVEE